ncbi:MAG: 5-formyltetrahydrofolate cyclo-ligase [Candidatus Omnitrophica bacterium]|nr:5-formyltetrahydrofolate cyclo-ligase [Candidatus Omnitrophota bacterium]MDD5488215.1 5-formyltetrahydrofolate cyclo-ligase [Candidatus Omnitrophota bacterium]
MVDNTNIIRGKEEIRKEMIRRLKGQAPSARDKKSLKIQKEVLASEEFKGSRTVMAYVSLPSEVGTDQFIQEAMERGKRIVVPYIGPDDQRIIASELTSVEELEKGPFGISQPGQGRFKAIPLKEIDLIVVPAIAYDKKNMRLGRGKGYYDRFLAEEGLSSANTIGVAFNFQIVDEIPSDPHDRPVQRVITD